MAALAARAKCRFYRGGGASLPGFTCSGHKCSAFWVDKWSMTAKRENTMSISVGASSGVAASASSSASNSAQIAALEKQLASLQKQLVKLQESDSEESSQQAELIQAQIVALEARIAQLQQSRAQGSTTTQATRSEDAATSQSKSETLGNTVDEIV
ncbi:MAG: FlxA-like family protein [Azonexus sp.]